ncbi:hypothetical protein HC766_00380 [Candidatus Gracilibacteria bacterium]|nr:hypothetical protein [Candidatus Gracilibacteria bacterium]NJS40848.1 hypothetical protein [Candidatus Gracilibacteria bacterium]
MKDYQLLDCGNQKKLEKYGKYILIRPCPQAIWQPYSQELWSKAHSEFIKESSEKGQWKALQNPEGLKRNKLGSGIPDNWEIMNDGTKWRIEPNEYGNIGVFTEHWTYLNEVIQNFSNKGKTLSLFTYTGSNTVDLVKADHKVTVVDSSKNAIDGYTFNLGLNNLSREGQRLILEDVLKFTAREIRRGTLYSNIICDAPSFGRGTKGEVFDIDKNLVELLDTCKQLLTPKGKIFFSLHSPRYTITGLQNLAKQLFPKHQVTIEEILNPCNSGINLPSGHLIKII